MNDALQQIRAALKGYGDDVPTGLLAVDTSAVEIELSFATGPRDFDGDGTDDGLEVLVHPKDRYGDTVKTPGSTRIILERPALLTLPGATPRQHCTWDLSAVETNDTWSEGTFSGYRIAVEWPGERPEPGNASLVVHFTTLSGRTLSARMERLKIIAEVQQ
jgi:hypothetical protein